MAKNAAKKKIVKKVTKKVIGKQSDKVSRMTLEELMSSSLIEMLNFSWGNYYKKCWKCEQAYKKECKQDKKFQIKYPQFELYICEKISNFDLQEYSRYRLLMAIDTNDVLINISNGALRRLQKKTLNVATGELHKDTKKILDKLPKDRMVDEVDVMNVMHEIGFSSKVKR